jgi:hypothetical protein
MKLPQRSYYDVIGVAPEASAAEIRDAYLLRSKVLHPDRFDAARQPAEWKLANELLRELNEAYSVLRDPALRAHYDAPEPKAKGTSTAGPFSRGARVWPRPRQSAAGIRTARLTAGHARFMELPAAVQKRLRARQADAVQPQVRVELGSRINRIMHKLPGRADKFLQHNLYITPLYIVYTRAAEVWYWPIAELKEVMQCQRPVPWASKWSIALFIFARGEQEVPRLTGPVIERIREAVKAFQCKAILARQQRDTSYFEVEDDFRDLALAAG